MQLKITTQDDHQTVWSQIYLQTNLTLEQIDEMIKRICYVVEKEKDSGFKRGVV